MSDAPHAVLAGRIYFDLCLFFFVCVPFFSFFTLLFYPDCDRGQNVLLRNAKQMAKVVKSAMRS